MADDYPDWYTGPRTDSSSSDGSVFDWFKGFGQSAIESIPELIGINPSTDTEHWRQEHPVGNFSSQLLGLAVPYTGWFKAVKGIKSIESMAKGLEEGSGFLGGAKATALRLAPLEAGRLAANELVGDQTTLQMLGATATDLALGAGIGGLLHGAAAAGKRDPSLRSTFPGLDVTLPLPLMARQMRSIIDSGVLNDNPEQLGRARGVLANTLNKARGEFLTGKDDYIGDIAHSSLGTGGDAKELTAQLNRIFKEGDGEEKLRRVRKFAQGDKIDYPSKFDWTTEAKEAGLPDGFEEHGQYFRTVSFRKFNQSQSYDQAEKAATRNAKGVNELITKNMQSVGDGNFMAREADDGMFIVARKYAGDVKKGTTDDKWVLFKTDKPGYFLPDQDKWAKMQIALAKWLPQQDLAQDAGPVYNGLTGFRRAFPLHNWQAITADGEEATKNTVSSLVPQNIAGKDNELVARVGEAANRYLLPRLFQFAFKKSPRASNIMAATKVAYDAAETSTNELLYGQRKVDEGVNLFLNNVRGGKPTGIDGLTPIKQLVDGASDATREEFWTKVWKPQVDPLKLDEMMLAGEISPETAKLGHALEAVNDWLRTTTQQVEEATGQKATEFPRGTYGLLRRWEGDSQFLLENEAGQMVAKVGGVNRRAAQQNVQKLIKENPSWRLADNPEISASQDIPGLGKYLREPSQSASALMDRQGLRGFKWDLEPTPTKNQLMEEYEGQIRRTMRYQANLSTADQLSGDMGALAKEDLGAYKIVKDRMLDYAGVQSTWGKLQNKLADEILGPMLGPNSASKIVGLTNTAMFNLTLGAGKLAYGVINALQFMQTVAPEVAFVLGKAVPEDLAPHYTWAAAGGTAGPTGGMAVLNPIKMMGQGFNLMRNPTKELRAAYELAANERVIEPRVVEDYIGASAARISDLKTAFSSGEGFTSWLRALSEFVPAETERLSRTHAFTTGWNMAKNFLHDAKGNPLSAESAYRFAKEFTEKTMYLYSTADKSRIFNTPAGSLMGLFKNWMFHYIASMADYTGQGLAKNNWAPLMWQMGGTMALGGLSAMPLYGVASKVSKLWSDKSLLQLSYDQFGEHADGMLYGLPSYMGLALTSGVDTPALSNPVRDASSLFGVAAWGRVQSLGKAVGGAFDNWEASGLHPGEDRGTLENLIKAFAPVSMYRGLSAFANPDAITSLGTGYPIQKDPSLVNRLLYSTGFTPTELQRGYDISQALYENHEELKKSEGSLGRAWAEAEMGGDTARMALIMRQSIVWGVDVSKVIKNGMYEIDKHRKDIIERHLKPKDIGVYRKAILGGREAARAAEETE